MIKRTSDDDGFETHEWNLHLENRETHSNRTQIRCLTHSNARNRVWPHEIMGGASLISCATITRRVSRWCSEAASHGQELGQLAFLPAVQVPKRYCQPHRVAWPNLRVSPICISWHAPDQYSTSRCAASSLIPQVYKSSPSPHAASNNLAVSFGTPACWRFEHAICCLWQQAPLGNPSPSRVRSRSRSAIRMRALSANFPGREGGQASHTLRSILQDIISQLEAASSCEKWSRLGMQLLSSRLSWSHPEMRFCSTSVLHALTQIIGRLRSGAYGTLSCLAITIVSAQKRWCSQRVLAND